MNKKISSSSACDIYQRVAPYCLVESFVVLTNSNVYSIMVTEIISLVQIICFSFGAPHDEYFFKRNFLFLNMEEIEDKQQVQENIFKRCVQWLQQERN